MKEEFEPKSVMEMSGGAILERVNVEMARVIENILDPNAKADAKRKITVTLELTPSSDRKNITVKTTAKSTLVPTDAVTTSLFIAGKPLSGEMAIYEAVPQVPGQLGIDGSEQSRPKILKIPYAG